MKQLQYVVRYLLKARGNNLIKIISLTLGLFVGLILFAQVAFEMSYDNFYPDKEQLYLLYVKGKTPGNETYDVHVVNSPFAPTMYKDIPEVISAANIFYNITDMRFKVDGNAFEERTVFADSLFFHTLGLPVLEGDPKELRVENVMFISESFAKRAFGDISKAINQSCKYEDMSYTVRGVFADLPENGHLQFDVAISMTRFTKEYSEDDARAWMGNDAYCCYVRLAP